MQIFFISRNTLENTPHLSIIEHRILILAIIEALKEKKSCNTFFVDIKNSLTPNPKNTYKQGLIAAQKMIKSVINIKRNHAWISYPLIKSFRKLTSTSFFSFEFYPEVRNFFFTLENVYSSVFLENLTSFKRYASMRLYEILKIYYKEGFTSWIIEIQSLISLVMANQGRLYDGSFGLINFHIFQPAIKEINLLTEIKVSFEKIFRKGEKGKAVEKLHFHVSEKTID